jgi:uncharacterized protein YfbU (UPF0304 family)
MFILLVDNKFHMEAPIDHILNAIEIYESKRLEVGKDYKKYNILTEEEYDKYRRTHKVVKEAKELFGKMRGLTEEEAKATQKAIENISKPFDKNIKEFF